MGRILAVVTGRAYTRSLQISKMDERMGLGEGQSVRDQKVI